MATKRKTAPPKLCPLNGRKCPEHQYVHGKEAEELRSGIETILALRVPGGITVRDFRVHLNNLIEGVDARDSLAYIEKRAKAKAVAAYERSVRASRGGAR